MTGSKLNRSPANLLIGLFFLSGCASGGKPCTEGGDTKWNNPDTPVFGIKKCDQTKSAEGKYVNHGSYKVMSEKGNPLLEGQFMNGKKHGTWSQYNEKGEKVMERYFDQGVEKMAPSK